MLDKFDRFVQVSSNWFGNAGAALLLLIPIITFLDILGTKLFDLPVPGSIELTGYLQALLIPCAAAVTLLCGQHIKVEIFTARVPESIKAVLDGVISLILFCVIIVVIWQSIISGMSFQSVGEYSAALHLPIHYIVYAMAFAFVPLCFAFLHDFLHLLRGGKSR